MRGLVEELRADVGGADRGARRRSRSASTRDGRRPSSSRAQVIAGEAATVERVSRSPPGASVRALTEPRRTVPGVAATSICDHRVGVVRVGQEADVGVAGARRRGEAVAQRASGPSRTPRRPRGRAARRCRRRGVACRPRRIRRRPRSRVRRPARARTRRPSARSAPRSPPRARRGSSARRRPAGPTAGARRGRRAGQVRRVSEPEPDSPTNSTLPSTGPTGAARSVGRGRRVRRRRAPAFARAVAASSEPPSPGPTGACGARASCHSRAAPRPPPAAASSSRLLADRRQAQGEDGVAVRQDRHALGRRGLVARCRWRAACRSRRAAPGA